MLLEYNIIVRKFKAVKLAVRVGSQSVELSVVTRRKGYSELNGCKHFANYFLL
jgi:hypothetical protein